jgi:hypothetical protein
MYVLMFITLRPVYLSEYRVVFALFVISKAGGLIYNREFHTGMSKLSSNDLLMLAGSFHGYIVMHYHCSKITSLANIVIIECMRLQSNSVRIPRLPPSQAATSLPVLRRHLSYSALQDWKYLNPRNFACSAFKPSPARNFSSSPNLSNQISIR